jgi:hypothetical protein
MKEVQGPFGVLGQRERLIAKLAIQAEMRPGEIFGLSWGRMEKNLRGYPSKGLSRSGGHANHSFRKAALSEGVLDEVEDWRQLSVDTGDDAWVFPLGTPDDALEGQLLASPHGAEPKKSRIRMGEFPSDAPDPRHIAENSWRGRKARGGSTWAYLGCQSEHLHAIASRKQARHGEQARKKPAGNVRGLNGAQTVVRAKIGTCKLLKRWSGRPGSNRRRPAWEIGQSFVFNDITAHGVDSGHEKRQQNDSSFPSLP